jgi:hypothetical protein
MSLMAHSVISRQRSKRSLSGVMRTSTTETTSRHGLSRYWWVPTAVLSTHYNDLADARGQLRSPEATTECTTNAQLLTGCTKCPMARSEATPSPAWVLPVRRSIHARGHGLRGRGALGGMSSASNIPVTGCSFLVLQKLFPVSFHREYR